MAERTFLATSRRLKPMWTPACLIRIEDRLVELKNSSAFSHNGDEIKNLASLLEAGLSGQLAAQSGVSMLMNPFDIGSEEYKLWRDSWLETDAHDRTRNQ